MDLYPSFLFQLICVIFPCEKGPVTESILPSLFNPRVGALMKSDDFVVENPFVITKSGPVKGYIMRTISNAGINAFEGIPYGETTAGVNRFKAPIPKSPWTTVLDATNSDIKCLHTENGILVVGQEDCLSLSIYTPQINKQEEKLPVIIWIHGGGYMTGYGNLYGPHVILDEEIILVTINYRLGVLGFLSTGDDVVPGNNGLKDQALAIKWVFENIEAFGGDATRITLMGQSSGATSVQLHMLSNTTRSYFSRAMAMSGSIFSSWGVHTAKIAANRKGRIAYITGCRLTEGSLAFVDCLRNWNPYLLVERQRWISDSVGIPTVLFAPVIEHWHEDAFLTMTPEEHYRNGDVAKIPFVTTVTKHETGVFLILQNMFQTYNKFLREFKKRLPVYLEYILSEKESRQTLITEMISSFYLHGQDPTTVETSVIESMISDRMYLYPTRKSIQAHMVFAPTYTYIFNVPTKKSLIYYFSQDPEKWGSTHSDDIVFMLNYTSLIDNWKKTDKEYPLVKLMCNMIVNFAATGEPYYLGENNKPMKLWEPVTDPRNIRFLQISHDIEMIDDPFKDRMKFWEEMNMTDMMPWLR